MDVATLNRVSVRFLNFTHQPGGSQYKNLPFFFSSSIISDAISFFSVWFAARCWLFFASSIPLKVALPGWYLHDLPRWKRTSFIPGHSTVTRSPVVLWKEP